MPSRVYSFNASELQAAKKLLSYDPYLDNSLKPEDLDRVKKDPEANIIFARKDYTIKDGITLGLDREKYYVCILADDEFLEKGEKKLKEMIKGLERVDEATEKKVIQAIEEERFRADSGVGMIFG